MADLGRPAESIWRATPSFSGADLYLNSEPASADTPARANIHSYSIDFLVAAALFATGLIAAAAIYPAQATNVG